MDTLKKNTINALNAIERKKEEAIKHLMVTGENKQAQIQSIVMTISGWGLTNEQEETLYNAVQKDSNGLVDETVLPQSVKNVVEYATRGDFPVTGDELTIFIDRENNQLYTWNGIKYLLINEKYVSLTETESIAGQKTFTEKLTIDNLDYRQHLEIKRGYDAIDFTYSDGLKIFVNNIEKFHLNPYGVLETSEIQADVKYDHIGKSDGATSRWIKAFTVFISQKYRYENIDLAIGNRYKHTKLFFSSKTNGTVDSMGLSLTLAGITNGSDANNVFKANQVYNTVTEEAEFTFYVQSGAWTDMHMRYFLKNESTSEVRVEKYDGVYIDPPVSAIAPAQGITSNSIGNVGVGTAPTWGAKLTVGGYTKLGDESPNFAYKTVVSTMPIGAGSVIKDIAHGISSNLKIISIVPTVRIDNDVSVIIGQGGSGAEAFIRWDNTNIKITNGSLTSDIDGKTVEFLIMYKN